MGAVHLLDVGVRVERLGVAVELAGDGGLHRLPRQAAVLGADLGGVRGAEDPVERCRRVEGAAVPADADGRLGRLEARIDELEERDVGLPQLEWGRLGRDVGVGPAHGHAVVGRGAGAGGGAERPRHQGGDSVVAGVDDRERRHADLVGSRCVRDQHLLERRVALRRDLDASSGSIVDVQVEVVARLGPADRDLDPTDLVAPERGVGIHGHPEVVADRVLRVLRLDACHNLPGGNPVTHGDAPLNQPPPDAEGKVRLGLGLHLATERLEAIQIRIVQDALVAVLTDG